MSDNDWYGRPKKGGYSTRDRCDELFPENESDERDWVDYMSEELMFRCLMIAFAIIAAAAAIASVAVIVQGAWNGDYLMMVAGGIATAAVSGGSGLAALYFGGRSTGTNRVFTDAAEREVLTRKQRNELRAARGGLVMQQRLYSIEEERDRMIHRQIEGPDDTENVRRLG